MVETDLISRQAAIDRINKQREHLKPDIDERDAIGDAAYRVCAEFIERLPSAQPEPLTVNFAREMDRETIEKLKKEMENAPVLIMAVNDSAQPEPKWISCSERLPAYGEDVLISIGGYCNVGHVVPVNEEERYNWYFSGWYHSPNDVDAWMPLPEPWRGGSDDRT